jgi:hypothetical protein
MALTGCGCDLVAGQLLCSADSRVTCDSNCVSAIRTCAVLELVLVAFLFCLIISCHVLGGRTLAIPVQ